MNLISLRQKLNTKILILAALVIAGSVLIYSSIKMGEPYPQVMTDAKQAIARVETLLGSSFVLRSGSAALETLVSKTPLAHLDTVETSNLSEARLYFESLDRVRILENSLITVEKMKNQESDYFLLTIKRGQIQIENYGREKSLMIAKNGELRWAHEYHQSQLAQDAVQNPEPSLQNQLQSNENLTILTDSLTEAEIQSALQSQKNAFLRCYAHLLQKEPEAKGECTLTFTIENSGRLGTIQVTSTTLTQKDFQNCLSEVVRRLEFRKFSGPSISTYYPLKFD